MKREIKSLIDSFKESQPLTGCCTWLADSSTMRCNYLYIASYLIIP